LEQVIPIFSYFLRLFVDLSLHYHLILLSQTCIQYPHVDKLLEQCGKFQLLTRLLLPYLHESTRRLFGWHISAYPGLSSLISSHKILFILPVEHYSFYQPNTLKVYGFSSHIVLSAGFMYMHMILKVRFSFFWGC
jgi:hypothetical protein